MTDPASRPRVRPLEVLPIDEDGRRLILFRDPFHYSDEMLTMTPLGALLAQLMDGTRTVPEVAAAAGKLVGMALPVDQVEVMAQSLDDAGFLDNERFEHLRRDVESGFLASTTRPSFLAGKSYPADRGELSGMLDRLYGHAAGAGESKESDGLVRGVISPHIDFSRGGMTYTHAYRPLAGTDAETFVIFGISHCGGGLLTPTRKSFETPLGTAPADHAILDGLQKRLAGDPDWRDIYGGEFAHRGEHSIEFQVVFLQHLLKGRPFSIVPVLCGFSYEEMDGDAGAAVLRFLSALREAVAESGRRVAYIAGVDFAHVGPQFGGAAPVDDGMMAEIEQKDHAMMDAMCRAGAAGFHEFIRAERNERHVCGYPAIYSLLHCVDSRPGRVRKYGKWHDPNGTVTFGSLTF